MSGIRFALAVGMLTVAAFLAAAGASTSDGTAPACFGAASHDRYHPCENEELRSEVIPSPEAAKEGSNAPCARITDDGPLRICEFGTPAGEANGAIALLGDSHAAHWRAALEYVASSEHWNGFSLALSGCPYSSLTRVLRAELRQRCIARNRAVPRWFERHPEIHTVFVSELSGARWTLPHAAGNAHDAEAGGYISAWARLPASVERIVVIRDTPKATRETAQCIETAQADRRDAGEACAVRRAHALDRDAAVSAARSLGPPRMSTIDMTRFFCDSDTCPPVIGGALVQKDVHHLSVVFVETLGPFLRDAVRRVAPPVY